MQDDLGTVFVSMFSLFLCEWRVSVCTIPSREKGVGMSSAV